MYTNINEILNLFVDLHSDDEVGEFNSNDSDNNADKMVKLKNSLFIVKIILQKLTQNLNVKVYLFIMKMKLLLIVNIVTNDINTNSFSLTFRFSTSVF